MRKTISRVGEKRTTNEGYEIEIIEYFRYNNCTIRFNTGFILKNIQYGHILKGNVKYPYHTSIYGIGYLGVGSYNISVKGKHNKSYRTWHSMLRRCYEYIFSVEHPTYKECSVAEEWHNFQNFAKWHEENWKDYMEGWHIDKDILIKGNKNYSPETCCCVPVEINSLFTKRQNRRGEYPIGVHLNKETGKFVSEITKRNKSISLGYFDTIEEAFQAYKIAKEAHIKEVADEWRGQITEPCYDAMYNYQVEITD